MPYIGDRPDEAVGYSIKQLVIEGPEGISASDLRTDVVDLCNWLEDDPDYLVGTPYTIEGIITAFQAIVAEHDVQVLKDILRGNAVVDTCISTEVLDRLSAIQENA